jgi:hypothetical protein
VSVVGAHITYVYPQRLVVPFGSVICVIYGPALKMVDLFFHHLPLCLLFCLWWYRRGKHLDCFITISGVLAASVLLVVYLQWNNVHERYGLTPQDHTACVLLILIVASLLAMMPIEKGV